MGKVVTITMAAGGEDRLLVVSEKASADGRERLPNGEDILAPGASRDFMVHADESLRVALVPPAIEAVAEESPAQSPVQSDEVPA